MNKSDARTSLGIYKRFARQTEETTNYLDRMKRLQNDLNMNIPMLKHVSNHFGLKAEYGMLIPPIFRRHRYPWQML